MTAKKDYTSIIFVLGVLVFYTAWMLASPYAAPPDENMRYDIPMYIYKYGVLPRGDDPALINNAWGLSYAFFPILSYMVSALFMKVVSVFSTEPIALLMAARFFSVLCGTGTAFMSLKIGRKLFGKNIGFLFAAMVAFLPQNVFISSYVNNDALAILSTSLIVWFWIKGIESNWDLKACVGLAVSISICALSYYNAYGFILCSIILFYATFFLKETGAQCVRGTHALRGPERSGDRFSDSVWGKTLIIVGIVFVLAGWWFIRNAILYDGDFLGMRSMDACAEAHAWPEVRPSAHTTPMSQGMSIFDMLFRTTWLLSVGRSFIGKFGGMSVTMPMWSYPFAIAFFLVGFVLFFKNERKAFSFKTDVEGKKYAILSWVMVLAALIPNLLSMYNSYASDYQPQGRYSLPMIIPFFYFIAIGYGSVLRKSKNEERNVMIMVAGIIIFALIAYWFALLPAYVGKDMFYLGLPN